MIQEKEHKTIGTADFMGFFAKDGMVSGLASLLAGKTTTKTALSGLPGGSAAVIAASVSLKCKQPQLIVLHDREEASYFQNDLQYMLGEAFPVMFLPASYKKAYQHQEVQNANVLARAEVFHHIVNAKGKPFIVVTYPDALTERVINKQKLIETTFTAAKGESVDMGFLTELLDEYGFIRTDFAYEPGEYSLRGGIMDIYSYASDMPFRVEFFGNEIESIRYFNPETQLSERDAEMLTIVPDVESSLTIENLASFFDFLPKTSQCWFADLEHAIDIADKYFVSAAEEFKTILEKNGNTKVLTEPEKLFLPAKEFYASATAFHTVEFGQRHYLKGSESFDFRMKPQPSFNKNFEMLADALLQNQAADIKNIILAAVPKQLQRLASIFDEINPEVSFLGLNMALSQGFIAPEIGIAAYTDHQIFERFHRYKEKERAKRSQALSLKELRSLNPGDYVAHIDYGIGRFAGLEKMKVGDREQETVRLVYRDNDLLYVGIHSLHKISKYSGKDGATPPMSKLGSQEWAKKKSNVKKQVRDIAKELISLYAKRKTSRGYAFSKDSYMQAALESSFIYEDTPDQASVTEAVKHDMEQPNPMDRLVCGDVGFGKTEVAIRAAFKAVCDGKQVGVLVPTTILAMQHFKTFSERLKEMPCRVDWVSRFRTAKEIKKISEDLAEGKIDILIGTHRITNKDMAFKDLGLMVIDEEQKFGVKTKEQLKQLKVNVDCLSLSATPIPRTLHFSLMGARDLSVINTPPPNRQPVTTMLRVFGEEIIRDAISYELSRGGQVFFVHNRIEDIDSVANIILRLVPDANVKVAHGQMEGTKLEKIMLGFIEGEFDVLVSTNIIESGLDIPNANTILINHANMFGLSDLHQMRGRVGRSNRKAFCYLLSASLIGLTADARKRLGALEEFSELGDGLKVAMRDLDIRGAGDLLGAEQSGFINDLGFEVYHKILDEAVEDLKETEFKELFEGEIASKIQIGSSDCVLETDFEVIIPEFYVANITERLRLYTEADNIKDETALAAFVAQMKDRFGAYPEQVGNLLVAVRLRWMAAKLGFEKITIKSDVFKAYFVDKKNEAYYQSPVFGNILTKIQGQSKKFRMKEHNDKLMLIAENINTIEKALGLMKGLED